MAAQRKKYKTSCREKAISWTVLLFLAWLAIFCFIWAIRVVLFTSVTNPCKDDVPDILSFEDPSELDYFTYPSTSTLMTSTRHYKDGFHSLVWQWGPGDELQLSLGRRLSGRRAGIEFWIYRNESSLGNLTVSLIDSALPSNEIVVLKFNLSLNFTGWRAAWVALREAFSNDSCPEKVGYDKIKFTAPVEKNSQMIVMDLLYMTRDITYQSRDQIVPPINGSIYDITATWQQTYRWSLVRPPDVNGTAPLSAKEILQLNELYLIEKRLVNWFANESVSPMEFKGNVLKRWKFMRRTVRKARRYFKHLNITVSQDGIITGSPLFLKRSQFGKSIKEKGGNKKLADAAFLVLFPLTLDHYFCSKSRYIHNIIARELANMNSIFRRKLAVRRIANYDCEYSKFLLSSLRKFKTPITQVQLRLVLRNLNQKKLDTIMLLLRYITDQGWTEGSAMGSLDHAMNQVGTGFVHSMFLLRKHLDDAGKLDTVLRTMKWYNDMGEIYQHNFEHSGTTADRLRTIIVYRLQIILMSRTQTIHEKRARLRDMIAYVRWCNNALLVHPAFLPTFKPDLSCFHHLGIYGTAYTPEALIQTSMIWYLLHGTSFSLDSSSKMTIRDRLFSKDRMAPRYSLPNSISGRFPSYFNAILVRMLPAYAFFSIRPQNLTKSGKLQEVSLGNDTEIVSLFLRLYKPSYPEVRKYLRAGTPTENIDYMSSIGSLQLLQAVYRKAKQAEIQPAAPQTGHWVQNFAALSIHRRKHWVVTVKGFSRYIWDFERSPTENVYGLYQSHGALQISNSERSLRAYDVEHGWDWTRVPGTTTIRLSLNEMTQQSPDGRYYQHSKLVGGVLLSSKNPSLSNGVFAMRFQRPSYRQRHKNKDAKQEIEFTFKKSVFFYNSLVVCLGSDISVSNSEPNITQTTLFQDKHITGISSIYINGKFKWLSDNFSQSLSESAAILDTNGNGYYIPEGSSANVAISRQTSRTNDGESFSYARYAVVWLDHGVNPVSASYQYAILVATDASSIEALRKAQTSDTPKYEVLCKNSAAHVVRFVDNDTAAPSITYGYAFFNQSVNLAIEGPVNGVSAQCLVMAEIDALNFSNINLSISSPDLNYNTTKVLNISTESGVNEYFYMRSQPVKRSVYLSKIVFLQSVLVNGKPLDTSQYGHYVTVRTDNPQHPILAGSEIVFKNLVNGESVEVYLTSNYRKINS